MVRPQTVLQSLEPSAYFTSPLPAPPVPAASPPASAEPLQPPNPLQSSKSAALDTAMLPLPVANLQAASPANVLDTPLDTATADAAATNNVSYNGVALAAVLPVSTIVATANMAPDAAGRMTPAAPSTTTPGPSSATSTATTVTPTLTVTTRSVKSAAKTVSAAKTAAAQKLRAAFIAWSRAQLPTHPQRFVPQRHAKLRRFAADATLTPRAPADEELHALAHSKFYAAGNGPLLRQPDEVHAQTRVAVTEDQVVEVVMRAHEELGHADSERTFRAVDEDFYGIVKSEVEWIVARCGGTASGKVCPQRASGNQTPQAPAPSLAPDGHTGVNVNLGGGVDDGDDASAMSGSGGIDGGTLPTSAAGLNVHNNVRKSNDGPSSTSASAPAPLTTRSAPATPAATQARRSRARSTTRRSLSSARKTPFPNMGQLSPPRMPSPVRPQQLNDPVVAALEPSFAAHLAQEPASGRRLRFSPQSVWDYKCYCYGYGPAMSRLGERARTERKAAIGYYTLRPNDNAISATTAVSGNNDADGAHDMGALWIRARGRQPSRPVVSTDEILATVLRVHRELGHADAHATFEAVARRYFGIPKIDVHWVVEHCPDCDNGPSESSSSSSSESESESPEPVARRGAARKSVAATGSAAVKSAAAKAAAAADAAIITAATGVPRKSSGLDATAADTPLVNAAAGTSRARVASASRAHVMSSSLSPPPEGFRTVLGAKNWPAALPPPPRTSSGTNAPVAATSTANDKSNNQNSTNTGNSNNNAATVAVPTPTAPSEQLLLAVIEIEVTGYRGQLHWLVCIFDVASAFCLLNAIERRHTADIAEAVLRWIVCYCRVPTTVRWPDAESRGSNGGGSGGGGTGNVYAGGGSPAFRRELAMRLRARGVQQVTAHAGGAGAGAVDADEGITDEIERRVHAWMAAHRTREWPKALLDVTLELNRRALPALGGRTPEEAFFFASARTGPAPAVMRTATSTTTSALHGPGERTMAPAERMSTTGSASGGVTMQEADGATSTRSPREERPSSTLNANQRARVTPWTAANHTTPPQGSFSTDGPRTGGGSGSAHERFVGGNNMTITTTATTNNNNNNSTTSLSRRYSEFKRPIIAAIGSNASGSGAGAGAAAGAASGVGVRVGAHGGNATDADEDEDDMPLAARKLLRRSPRKPARTQRLVQFTEMLRTRRNMGAGGGDVTTDDEDNDDDDEDEAEDATDDDEDVVRHLQRRRRRQLNPSSAGGEGRGAGAAAAAAAAASGDARDQRRQRDNSNKDHDDVGIYEVTEEAFSRRGSAVGGGGGGGAAAAAAGGDIAGGGAGGGAGGASGTGGAAGRGRCASVSSQAASGAVVSAAAAAAGGIGGSGARQRRASQGPAATTVPRSMSTRLSSGMLLVRHNDGRRRWTFHAASRNARPDSTNVTTNHDGTGNGNTDGNDNSNSNSNVASGGGGGGGGVASGLGTKAAGTKRKRA